jgi:hypothetical protein
MEQKNTKSKVFILFLLIIILFTGVYFRFFGVDWNQGANLHPDEYGLTNTLTQLSLPKNISDYFNTRISPISPYQKYDLSGNVIANGPDNSMRWGQWPIILIRGLAEITDNTGYDELRITGRIFSAFMDCMTLLLIFLIGWKLYGFTVGLLGATFSSLAVLQIQQSHFMTVDNFAVFFSVLTMFSATLISLTSPVKKSEVNGKIVYHPNLNVLKWYILFGVGLGMTIASKINLLPILGMVFIASFISIAEIKLNNKWNLYQIFGTTGLFILVAIVCAFITFRISQPMAFRAESGNTSFFTFHLNHDWVESMKLAQQESSGNVSSPPAEQWTDRPAIIFPFTNMVLWGMGLPLGLASCIGFFYAAWQTFRHGQNWKKHLIPLVWVGGYFLFMATRWVKSVRYFLPIYPFLCLLGAWILLEFYHHIRSISSKSIPSLLWKKTKPLISLLPLLIVLCGTFIWAFSFVNSIYGQDNTRIQATKWILDNIPAPIHLKLTNSGENFSIPISVPDGQQIDKNIPYSISFSPNKTGKLTTVILPHISNSGGASEKLILTISTDSEGNQIVDKAILAIPSSQTERGVEVQGIFSGTELDANKVYFLTASSPSSNPLLIYRNTIASEDWDESLPVRFNGYDPFGQFYQGITMQVRWGDNEQKREIYYNNIQAADYIILSSQRSIWSVCRLPLMYPLTLTYYRALFDGQLGFSQIAAFQAPIRIGALRISDLGGIVSWGAVPSLSLFNFNLFAAEEAFSVYDHAPVWIFAKSSHFSFSSVKNIMGTINLNEVQIQLPKDTKVVPFK